MEYWVSTFWEYLLILKFPLYTPKSEHCPTWAALLNWRLQIRRSKVWVECHMQTPVSGSNVLRVLINYRHRDNPTHVMSCIQNDVGKAI